MKSETDETGESLTAWAANYGLVLSKGKDREWILTRDGVCVAKHHTLEGIDRHMQRVNMRHLRAQGAITEDEYLWHCAEQWGLVR
jgi:hypothetical protein